MSLPSPILAVAVSDESVKVYEAGYREGLSVHNTGSKTVYFGYGRAAVAGAPENLVAGGKGVISGRAALEELTAVCAEGESSTLSIQEV
jgi:hypothetical protein